MIRTNETLANYVKQLKPTVEERFFDSRQLIVTQGKRLPAVYIVKTGVAKCYLMQDNGEVFIQEFFGKGELFGEVEAIKKEISFCSIEAATPVTCYYIPIPLFYKLLEKDTKFTSLILQAMATKINYKAIRHSYNQQHTLSENLLRLTQSLPGVLQVIPKKDIANYLGITTRSLNRVINDLNKQGVLPVTGKQRQSVK